MHKLRTYFMIFTAALFSACKTTQLNTEEVNRKLPTTYPNQKDTVHSNPSNWKQRFFDPGLKILIDSALRNNFDLRTALRKVEIANAELRLNKGIRLPDLNAGATAGARKYGDYTMEGVGNYDTKFSPNLNDNQQIPNPIPDYYVGFHSTWEIDLWGKLKNRKKAAASRFIASQFGKDLIITNLIAEVATSYFELLALDQENQVLSENIALQKEALDLVIAQKEVGRANELAVEMMKAQWLSSRTLKEEVKRQIIIVESRLNFLCGTFPSTVKRDTVYSTRHLMDSVNPGIPSDLLRNRPDIRQAESELNATNADVKSAQAAFYPSLNINANIGFQTFKAFLLLDPASLAYNAVGNLTAPLLNRRQLKSQLMSSKAKQKQAYINYEKTVVNSFKEVYVALANIKNIKTMYELKKQETDVLKKSINTSGELFKAGQANYLEVIIAQKNALQSQLELIDLYKKQNIARVDLYRSIGGGWK